VLDFGHTVMGPIAGRGPPTWPSINRGQDGIHHGDLVLSGQGPITIAVSRIPHVLVPVSRRAHLGKAVITGHRDPPAAFWSRIRHAGD